MKFPCNNLPAEPIWLCGGGQPDEYIDIYPSVSFCPDKKYILRIAADTDRAVWLDECLVSFGQYEDYPQAVTYEDIPLDPREDSVLKITARHSGIDSQTRVAQSAYVIFCIYEDGVPAYSSGSHTLCRPTPEYLPHLCHIVTPQMGEGYALSGRARELPLTAAEVVEKEFSSLRPRPIKPLVLGEKITPATVREGYFRFEGGTDSASLMTRAALDTEKDHSDGKYFLYDLGAEAVGFPEISFRTEKEVTALLGWGEHTVDGICRTAIGPRRFTADILTRRGYNHYFPVLCRLGCRYLQIFIPDTEVCEVTLTFRPALLPVSTVPQDFCGERAQLRRKIRDTAIHTLRCCMHEHYEDCPWREQALYTLDSRNQMIAGYKVFSDLNADFVRASLDLISRGVRPDGILSLCYPAGKDYPIPYYSLAYFIQMAEYIEHTADTTLAAEKYGMLTDLLDTFLSRCDTCGEYRSLPRRFPDSEGYWNFYEWSPTLSGDRVHKNTPVEELPCEAILAATLSLALSSMAKISAALGKSADAERYSSLSAEVSRAIARVFYDPDSRLFLDFTDRPDSPRTVLTQAMCILCGAGDRLDTEKMLSVILSNGAGGEAIPATLSMACFRYDALLAADREKYAPHILDEIDRDGEYMLSRGATTFWETLKGEADFGGAGSLCHGWSAMSAYYYAILL